MGLANPPQPPHAEAQWGTGAVTASLAPQPLLLQSLGFHQPWCISNIPISALPPSRPGFALRRRSSHFKQQTPSPTLLYAHPAPMGQNTASLQPAPSLAPASGVHPGVHPAAVHILYLPPPFPYRSGGKLCSMVKEKQQRKTAAREINASVRL